jgi:hypothetical protein
MSPAKRTTQARQANNKRLVVLQRPTSKNLFRTAASRRMTHLVNTDAALAKLHGARPVTQ